MTDWRLIDDIPTAWFDTPSLTSSAELAGHIMDLSPGSLIDLRATGLRVRLDSGEHTAAISTAAQELRHTADPAALQNLTVVIESPNPPAVQRFWQHVLGYPPGIDRDPTVHVRPAGDPRPLRNRLHLDVVRPATTIEHLALGEPTGPYGVRHRDPDGNEVDLVPANPLQAADWQQVFSAIACYRTTTPHRLAAAAATLADRAGFPLLIDLRPGLVILDSGKDRWQPDTHGPDTDFTTLAADLQTTARDLGATVEVDLPRFVQLFLDAADVDTVRGFWRAALGYTPDHRHGVNDIFDPRRLNPVLVFQQLDTTDTARRRQRNRTHLELAVPADHAQKRLATTLDAGGQLLDRSDSHWRIADPEGNELTLYASGPQATC